MYKSHTRILIPLIHGTHTVPFSHNSHVNIQIPHAVTRITTHHRTHNSNQRIHPNISTLAHIGQVHELKRDFALWRRATVGALQCVHSIALPCVRAPITNESLKHSGFCLFVLAPKKVENPQKNSDDARHERATHGQIYRKNFPINLAMDSTNMTHSACHAHTPPRCSRGRI